MTLDIDLQALREIAEAQAEAYRVMLLIGEGVGGLGVRHPERYESMIAWDDMSANGHADTVLALLARLEVAEKVIADALDVFRPGASVPLGVSEARHFDRLLAEGHRILSAYTNTTNHENGRSER